MSVHTPVSTLWCSCKTIIDTHKNNPTDARKRVPTIAEPGGMCEPWCAAYLVGRTLLLVLAVWLGLGGEPAQTAKFPLHYASVPGGGRTYDQSLPPKVWGAVIQLKARPRWLEIIPAAEINMPKIFCTSRPWSRPFRPELKMIRPVGKVYLAGRLRAVGTASPRSNSL